MVLLGAWVRDRRGGMPDLDKHVSSERPDFVGADPKVAKRASGGPGRAVIAFGAAVTGTDGLMRN